MTVPLAILDRDGTIIDVVRDEETGAISVAFHPGQLRLLAGAVEGMRALQKAGFTLAIATNQPAPGQGQFSADAVRRTNDALVERLAAGGRAHRRGRGVHAPPGRRARAATASLVGALRLPQAEARHADRAPRAASAPTAREPG